LVGSSYVAARYLPPRMYAIFMGLTQYLGMLGVAFGSKPVQMAIDPFGLFEVSWEHVWLTFAIIGLVSAAVTWIVMPREQGDTASHHDALSFSSLLQRLSSSSAISRVGEPQPRRHREEQVHAPRSEI
jgi:hypothetical protein